MSLQLTDVPLILASQSAIRAKVLQDAGLMAESVPSNVDENILKAEIVEPDVLARCLAEQKALKVSVQYPEALVIGADQVLACGDRLFDKPADMAEARDNLKFLAGKRHELHSGVALVRDGDCLWSQTVTARLKVKSMTDTFLDAYLEAAGDAILGSVGCYRLEEVGIQLFEEIDGDHLTIFGLPLLQLLPQLRKYRAVL